MPANLHLFSFKMTQLSQKSPFPHIFQLNYAFVFRNINEIGGLDWVFLTMC